MTHRPSFDTPNGGLSAQPHGGRSEAENAGRAGAEGEPAAGADVVEIERWPGERALGAAVLLAAILAWGALLTSRTGVACAVVLGVAYLLARARHLAHLRGSTLRVTPEALPELYDRLANIGARLGLPEVPEAYLVAPEGAADVLAARFFRPGFVVLDPRRLDACGDDDRARDFLIAHAVAGLAAGHERWQALLLPGRLVPLLGAAWARACVYTRDRCGLRVCGDRESALRGLCILALGPALPGGFAPRSLLRQGAGLDSGWIRLGEWLRSRPPAVLRAAAIAPDLAESPSPTRTAGLRAVAWLVSLTVLVLLAVATLLAPPPSFYEPPVPSPLASGEGEGGATLASGGDPLGAASSEQLADREASEADAPASERPAAPSAALAEPSGLEAGASGDSADAAASDREAPGSASLALGEASTAEEPEPSAFARALDRELEGVFAHPELLRRAEGLEPEATRALIDPLVLRGVPRLPDDRLHTRTRLMSVVLSLADAPTCAALMRGEASGPAVTQALDRLEAADAEAWAEVSSLAARLELEQTPPPARAPASEVDRSFALLLGALPEPERERLAAGLVAITQLDDEEACWVARSLYGAIAGLPDRPERVVLERALVN